MFDIGDRVVCVDAKKLLNSVGNTDHCPLIVGNIYTIVDLYPKGRRVYPFGPAWRDSVEVSEVRHPWGCAGVFAEARFRKLGRADLLTKLLADPQPQDERDGKRVVTPKEKV